MRVVLDTNVSRPWAGAKSQALFAASWQIRFTLDA